MPRHGCAASIGGGALQIGSTSVRVRRTVDASVPCLDWAEADPMSQMLASSLAGREHPVRSELSSTSLSLLEAGDPAAAALLLGRGSGLTPVGDDVLAGWRVTVGAARPGSCPVARQVARLADRATTLLSATLLDRAAAGDVVPEFRDLFRQLRRQGQGGGPEGLDRVVDRILAIGHTSGAGMLLGCLIALDHLRQTHPKAGNSRR